MTALTGCPDIPFWPKANRQPPRQPGSFLAFYDRLLPTRSSRSEEVLGENKKGRR
jgi:hypothetical protein